MVSLPKIPPPIINEAPDIKLIGAPQPHVVTLNQFKYFVDACEDFKVAGQEDAYSIEELAEFYPGLDQESACGFAIYGLPTQEWLNMEQDLTTSASALEEVRKLLNASNQQLIDLYEIIKSATDEIKKTLE